MIVTALSGRTAVAQGRWSSFRLFPLISWRLLGINCRVGSKMLRCIRVLVTVLSLRRKLHSDGSYIELSIFIQGFTLRAIESSKIRLL